MYKKDDEADDYNERGISYFNVMQYADAVKEFTKAINIIKTDPDYFLNRAMAYYSLKMYDAAIKDCKSAITLSADRGDYHNTLGAIYDDMKDLKSAMNEFNEAIRLRMMCLIIITIEAMSTGNSMTGKMR